MWSDLSSGRSVALPFLRSKDQSIGSESNDIDIEISRESKNREFFKMWNETRKKRIQNEQNEQNALCPCFFGRSACRVPSAF